ncbi:MAG: hypothetical protein AABY30_03965 [Candidatus Thermoplasmatota archaeon]
MAGERDAFAKGIRAKAQLLVQRFDDASVFDLRSDLLALEAYLRANPRAATAKLEHALARASALAETSHAFASELHGFLGQKAKSETASMFDLGSIGVLALENILTADKITLQRIVMNSLSEALMFIASRQYVAGSREVLEGLYRQHSAMMYRELWALATDHRKGLAAKDVKEIQSAIDGFFGRLSAPGVTQEARIAVLRQFYALLLTLRTAELLEALGG